MTTRTPTTAALIEGFLAQSREYAVICMDPDGIVCGWLGAASQVFGYEAADIVGKPGSELFTPHDLGKGLDKHELEVARRDSRSEDDRWHVRQDGTRIWVTGSVDAIRDAAGGLLGFVKLVRDRTDARAHVDNLENQLAAGEAKDERTRAFLRTLGHELRNPLTPLLNAAHILQRLHGDPKAQTALQVVFSQIAALRQLADDLMDASRFESGKVELKQQRVDLREVLQQACVGFDGAARDKAVELQAVLPEGSLDVLIDRSRFQQVVSNLLSNAIKYTPAGGRVWIKATQEGAEVVLRIEDTGMGIGPEMLPRLFELFSRAESAAAVAPTGLGIGLAVAREVVELHGGTIQARSAGPGKGSEFSVRLPATSRPGA